MIKRQDETHHYRAGRPGFFKKTWSLSHIFKSVYFYSSSEELFFLKSSSSSILLVFLLSSATPSLLSSLLLSIITHTSRLFFFPGHSVFSSNCFHLLPSHPTTPCPFCLLWGISSACIVLPLTPASSAIRGPWRANSSPEIDPLDAGGVTGDGLKSQCS